MPASAAQQFHPHLTVVPRGPERAQAIPRAFESGRFLNGSVYVYRIGWKGRRINRRPDYDGSFYRVLSGNSNFTTSLLANATPVREKTR